MSESEFLTPPVAVARRNQSLECGEWIGQLNIKLMNGRVERVAIHCTKSKQHKDACEFVGVELVVSRRRREDGGNASLILPRNHD